MPDLSTIQWMELASAEELKLNNATKAQQFRFFALKLIDAPYVWGKENLFHTDCSGTISFPLYLMGYDIRLTADTYFKYLFSKSVSDPLNLSKVMAIFYLTKKKTKHGNKTVKAGTVTHVTPVVGHYVVLNAGDPVKLSTALTVRKWYEPTHEAIWREIDWDTALNMHKSGKYAWDVDPILKILRGEGNNGTKG